MKPKPKPTRYRQVSNMPTSKVLIQTIASALVTVVATAVVLVFGVELNDETQTALGIALTGFIVTVLPPIAAWFKRPSEGDGIEPDDPI